MPALFLIQMTKRLKKTWKPQLFKRELYSEILNHKFTISVTARTLDLIDAAFGFDFYILKVIRNCPNTTNLHLRSGSLCDSNVQLFSDSNKRPELQTGDGSEESDAAAPGSQSHGALPR